MKRFLKYKVGMVSKNYRKGLWTDSLLVYTITGITTKITFCILQTPPNQTDTRQGQDARLINLQDNTKEGKVSRWEWW